jgi:HlyD family secretion protein
MRKVSAIILVLLVLAVVFLVAVAVAPAQVDRLWRAAGLPPESLQRLAAMLPGDSAASLGQPAEPSPALIVSGTLEAEETRISSEIAGQVTEVLVEEGQAVEAGQPVARLDQSYLQAQIAEADQAVQTAQVNLALAQAGPRQSQVDAAKAALRQAQAALDGAKQGAKDARRARDELQEIDAQIHAAQSRAALAQRQIEQARARQASVSVVRESIAGDGSDQGQTQRAIYDKQIAAAAEAIAAAEQEARGAQRTLRFLQDVRANPAAPDAGVRAAEGLVRQAEAGVRVAEAGLAAALAGPRQEAIDLAQAKVGQAKAARDALQVQADKAVITSPLAGVVTARIADPGEVASPGAPLLTVADLSQITLVIYVPESRLGQVHVGQAARVTIDAYPDRPFAGTVSFIAPRAEFTPKNVQTREGRVATVFAVEIKLANAEDVLKPGMPADAELVVE